MIFVDSWSYRLLYIHRSISVSDLGRPNRHIGFHEVHGSPLDLHRRFYLQDRMAGRPLRGRQQQARLFPPAVLVRVSVAGSSERHESNHRRGFAQHLRSGHFLRDSPRLRLRPIRNHLLSFHVGSCLRLASLLFGGRSFLFSRLQFLLPLLLRRFPTPF